MLVFLFSPGRLYFINNFSLRFRHRWTFVSPDFFCTFILLTLCTWGQKSKLIFILLFLRSCEIKFIVKHWKAEKKSHKLLVEVREWDEKFTELSMIAICFVIEDMLEVNDCIKYRRKTSIIKTCPAIKIKINYKTNNNKLLHVTHGALFLLSVYYRAISINVNNYFHDLWVHSLSDMC